MTLHHTLLMNFTRERPNLFVLCCEGNTLSHGRAYPPLVHFSWRESPHGCCSAGRPLGQTPPSGVMATTAMSGFSMNDFPSGGEAAEWMLWGWFESGQALPTRVEKNPPQGIRRKPAQICIHSDIKGSLHSSRVFNTLDGTLTHALQFRYLLSEESLRSEQIFKLFFLSHHIGRPSLALAWGRKCVGGAVVHVSVLCRVSEMNRPIQGIIYVALFLFAIPAVLISFLWMHLHSHILIFP